MFDEREKVVILIDGANFYATAKALGFDIDYKQFLAAFRKRAYVLRAYYFTAVVENEDYNSIRPLIDWLDYNGYSVITKPAKEFTDATGRRRVQGRMDQELTVEAMMLADTCDHIVLCSGSGDYRRLIEALQSRGKRVTVVSTMRTQPPMISDDLRRQADNFLDLASLETEVGRTASERGPRPTRGTSSRDDDGYDTEYDD